MSRVQAVIMDEVDGMAGNEDRGGIAELVLYAAYYHAHMACMKQ